MSPSRLVPIGRNRLERMTVNLRKAEFRVNNASLQSRRVWIQIAIFDLSSSQALALLLIQRIFRRILTYALLLEG